MRSLAVCMVLAMAGNALAAGMLVDKEEWKPLAVKHLRVNVSIDEQVATTKIDQVFRNNSSRQLEAVYIFPLPEGAAINDFSMMINGKLMSGELVESGKAREIYQSIVSRMKDPGLLEYMDDAMLRVSVFPILPNSDQRIELTYTELLKGDSGLVKFTLPMKAGKKASATMEDFTVGVKISSNTPIKAVYSPTHELGVNRKSDTEVTVGFEEMKSVLDKDFELYYGLDKGELSMSLLTFRKGADDGYFLLMANPGYTLDKDEQVKKAFTYVIDTSGSMSGKPIEQVKEALSYCVKSLAPEDRFNIIRFSTDIDPLFTDGPVVADKGNVDKAVDFIDRMKAAGGTNIYDALDEARRGAEGLTECLHTIVFLTDGKPTIGTDDTEEIVKGAVGEDPIFVFGVGEDLNALLLDTLAAKSKAVTKYVKPDQEIEDAISALQNKASFPVLTGVKLDFGKMDVRDVYPREVPNLFRGDQALVLGRYRGEGDAAVTLTGTRNGAEKKFVFEGTFPKEGAEHGFIANLWAHRKVGFLLEEIRLNGEKDELKDAVIALSKEYGIMTTYTSFLVLEDDKAYAQNNIPRDDRVVIEEKRPGRPGKGKWGRRSAVSFDDRMERDAEARRADGLAMSDETAPGAPAASDPAPGEPEPGIALDDNRFDTAGGAAGPAGAAPIYPDVYDEALAAARKASDAAEGFDEDSGKKAIDASQSIARFKDNEVVNETFTRKVGDRLFLLVGESWVESSKDEENGDIQTLEVLFGSNAYFRLLELCPELADVLALGENISFRLGAIRVIVRGGDGVDTLSAEQETLVRDQVPAK